METDVHFLSYLAQFFLELKMSRTKLQKNSKRTFCVQ